MTDTNSMDSKTSEPADDSATVAYFGYGAMVNPISRSRRVVETCNERPAILRNYRLDFEQVGAATVIPTEGSEVHGVLMEFPVVEHWKKIQEFETGYDTVVGSVYPYGSNEPVEAHFFTIPKDKLNKSDTSIVTQERYLKIIKMGMIHHGVDPTYVETHVMTAKCTPSRTPEDYLTFPVVDSERRITLQEYEQLNTNEHPHFIVGCKVFRVTKVDKEQGIYKWLKGRIFGHPCRVSMVYETLYDPDLPPMENERMEPIHVAWVENQLADFFRMYGFEAERVGTLSEE